MDAVVGVAYDTSGKTLIRKGLAVRALLIHLRLEDVAVGANVLNFVDARRYGAMIAMAGGTGGCAQVASDREGIVVDAGIVIGKLIGGDAVGLHVTGIGVATRTRFGHVHGING